MTKISGVPGWQRALKILTGTVVGVVVIGALYWIKVVFVPLALAIFLTFLLNPLVRVLQRRHVGRVTSVTLVVLLVLVLLGGFGWVIANQVTGLAKELPDYTVNVKKKIKSLQNLNAGTTRLQQMVEDISTQLKGPPASPDSKSPNPVSAPAASPGDNSSWLGQLPGYLGTAVETLGGLALALVLALFMLLKREELRNRFIRLIGRGHLTFTTKAVDEAGQRISRYLLMQLIVNVAYGLVLALALFLIGVNHALLWGLVAAILRYVPYIGGGITALLLCTLSLALFDGWLQPLLVLGVIIVMELVTANLVEPWLFGQSIGVSEVALLLAAAFWAFLWGPVGLVLSGPLTVCLVVLGKYVPQLEFFDVLLGDEPALDPDVSYYQRLLARDQDEATGLVLARAKGDHPDQVYDDLLVPALIYLKRDRERDELAESDEKFVYDATREIVEDLGERQVALTAKTVEPTTDKGAKTAIRRIHVVACPAHDEADALALEMLRQLLDPVQWEVEVISQEMLSSETVDRVAEHKPAVVCIAALPPGGLAHSRYLCKRLRARLPKAKILVGRWGLRENQEENQNQLREAGADQVATALIETVGNLNSWLPVLLGDAKEEEDLARKAEAGRGQVAGERKEMAKT